MSAYQSASLLRKTVVVSLLSVCVAPVVALAQAKQPKPITRTWLCTNDMKVLINFHPRRMKEEAWLTYIGNRVEVYRVPAESGVSYASKDKKVTWQENGEAGSLNFEGLPNQPLSCQLKKN